MEKKIEYTWETPGEFIRHPLHEKMLLSPEEKNQAGYAESVLKYGKLTPVLYIEDSGIKYIVDGWGYVADAIEKGIPYVLALKVEASTEAEIMQVIAEANSTYHTLSQSLYRMAEALYSEYSTGKGYRSDLKEDVVATDGGTVEDTEVNTDDAEDTAPSKRPTIYEKIGQMMGGLPGTRIKHLLLVGRINPLYLERMDVDRMSLYAAYLNCKKEVKGITPSLPPVKEPEYYSNNTGVPDFSEGTSTADETADEDTIQEEPTKTAPEEPLNNNGIQEESDDFEEVPVFVTVRGRCLTCGVETNVEIDIKQLKNIKL